MDISPLIISLQTKILPHYKAIGSILGIYICGSLTNGYTEIADIDVKVIWDGVIPDNKDNISSKLNDDQTFTPMAIEYKDVNLERFQVENQEYNVGHVTTKGFRENVELIMNGEGIESYKIINPLVSVSAFYYGQILEDSENILLDTKSRLDKFPQKLTANILHLFKNRKDNHLKDLEIFLEREDAFAFDKTMQKALKLTMQTIFTLNDIYYPGDKWLIESITKFELGMDIKRAFSRCFSCNKKKRIYSLTELVEIVRNLE